MGLTRKRLLIAATESTYGTSASPVGTDAILVEDDLKISPLESTALERKVIQPYFGKRRQLLTKKYVKIEFSVEFAGSGTAGTAPEYGRLLKACGMAETVVASTSVTYAPLSTAGSSVTMAFHADGQKHLALGCRGNVKFSAKVNDIPKLSFEFTGLYATPTDASLPTPTYDAQAQPVEFSQANTTNLTINGFTAGCLESFDFDLKNSVVYRELVGCTKQVRITDRSGEGKLMIEAPSISAHNFFSDAESSAQGAIGFTHGTAAGNIIAVSIPYANLGAPSYGDSDGIMMLEVPFGMVPSSAGNDELSLVYT